MHVPRTATYIPLATQRTKNVVKHLQPGERHIIDAVNVDDAQDRIEVQTWAVDKGDGIHINYTDGNTGAVIELGYADQVRVAIEEAATEEPAQQ